MSGSFYRQKEYCQHLQSRNFASGTVARYTAYLARFFAWLETKNDLKIVQITAGTINEYQRHLSQRVNARGIPNSVCYQNNNLKALKSYFRFLRENAYLVHDPAADVSYAKAPSRLPRSILTQAEMKRLLHAPNSATAVGYRDRTILEVFYSTGMRRNELINLQIEDMDLGDGVIRIVCGKGSKDRVVPVGKIACRYLENYLTAVRPMLVRTSSDRHVFLSLGGRKMSENRVWGIVKHYGQKARLQKTISQHTFRHTGATHMLRNRANVRHIQELLGHASLETTQIYTSVSITDLKAVHRRCHPREKDRD